jgi:hypothetical protein
MPRKSKAYKDIQRLREIISIQIQHIHKTMREDPSKVTRNMTVGLDRFIRMYVTLIKLYGAEEKEVKIRIIQVDAAGSNKEALGDTESGA